jgi:hypothetical protein
MGKGGIIGKANIPTASTPDVPGKASGVWNLRSQEQSTRNAIWPINYYTLFDYANFASTAGLELVSTASITANEIYITSAVPTDVGNVYLSSLNRFDKDFFLSWNFECSGGNGADGFCIQWTQTNNTTGGGGGSVSRIVSADTAHAIMFQTFGGNFVWYDSNVLISSTANVISWRQNVFYWMDYDHAAQTAKIYVSTTSTKPSSASYTLTSFVFDATSYYFGFGAATGGSNDNHRLKSMKMIVRS